MSTMRRLARASARQDGFTLIEMMMVIAIIGFLMGALVYRYSGIFDRSKYKTAKIELAHLKGSLEMYRADYGSYPTTEQGLNALVSPPQSTDGSPNSGYLDAVPADPWGHPFFYQSDGNTYTLRSLGRSGQMGSGALDADQVAQSP